MIVELKNHDALSPVFNQQSKIINQQFF